MDRTAFVLAGMSPAGNSPFSPVQVQKLFFLLDRNVADHIGGPHFSFEPYDYGPFDKQVYYDLEALAADGLIEISDSHPRSLRTYRLTEKGHEIGARSLATVIQPVREYISDVAHFVRSRSFAQLVSAIYAAHPDMEANSVFVQQRR